MTSFFQTAPHDPPQTFPVCAWAAIAQWCTRPGGVSDISVHPINCNWALNTAFFHKLFKKGVHTVEAALHTAAPAVELNALEARKAEFAPRCIDPEWRTARAKIKAGEWVRNRLIATPVVLTEMWGSGWDWTFARAFIKALHRSRSDVAMFQQRVYLRAWILQERFPQAPLCRLCKTAVESFDHIFRNCSIFRAAQSKWMMECQQSLRICASGQSARDLFWGLVRFPASTAHRSILISILIRAAIVRSSIFNEMILAKPISAPPPPPYNHLALFLPQYQVPQLPPPDPKNPPGSAHMGLSVPTPPSAPCVR